MHAYCNAEEMTHLVLKRDTSGRRGGLEHLQVVCPLLYGVEPDDRSNDEDYKRVKDKKPIEHDEADCDMVLLHDCTNGDSKREE